MKVAIMQPYFLPYIGYFQLISAVDLFIVYDNIQYTKKGWINRNRILRNGADAFFTLPLKKASDYCDVVERELAESFDRATLLNQFRGAYGRAPCFAQTFPLLERVVQTPGTNLFGFIHASILAVRDHLGLDTEVRASSEVAIDHRLKGEDKVLALCQALGATTYINAIGGVELYARPRFAESAIELRFLKSRPFEYPQFGGDFVPWLSIVDVLMFNPLDRVGRIVREHYDLL